MCSCYAICTSLSSCCISKTVVSSGETTWLYQHMVVHQFPPNNNRLQNSMNYFEGLSVMGNAICMHMSAYVATLIQTKLLNLTQNNNLCEETSIVWRTPLIQPAVRHRLSDHPMQPTTLSSSAKSMAAKQRVFLGHVLVDPSLHRWKGSAWGGHVCSK